MKNGFNNLGHIMAHFKEYRKILSGIQSRTSKIILDLLDKINDLVKAKYVVFTDRNDLSNNYPGFIAYSDMTGKEILTLRLLVKSYYQQVEKL